jgi:hypothetical protein
MVGLRSGATADGREPTVRPAWRGRRPDPRTLPQRVLLYLGCLLFLGMAAGVLWSLPQFPADERTFPIWFGSVSLAIGLVVTSREVVILRLRGRPPKTRTALLESGERALHVPRHPMGAMAAAGATMINGIVAAALAVLAWRYGAWLLAVPLTGGALFYLLAARPHRARGMAGGIWFTPTRLVHRDGGVSWEATWDEVGGAAVGERLAVVPRPGRTIHVRKARATYRPVGPPSAGGVALVETLFLPVGQDVLVQLIGRAVVDPEFRARLGSDSPVE